MKHKILFVEDDINIGFLTKQHLESLGYEVALCKDGGQAMSQFHTFSPDLCLLDVMLPYRDGFSIGREIRAEDSKTPIIFLTAKSQLGDVLKGFESGANDYIKKPFSLEELQARMKSLLKLSSHELEEEIVQNEFEVGQYHFNYYEQMLVMGDEERMLSPKEADLLRELCIHMQSTMDKSKALKKIWGDDTFYNGRSMDVYITKIRKYLSGDPAIEILNLRGVGYKLLIRN